MGHETFCICKTKSSSKFVNSASYEKNLRNCFGPEASGRSGKICESCKGNLLSHEKSTDKTFFHKTDCRVGVKKTKRSSSKEEACEAANASGH